MLDPTTLHFIPYPAGENSKLSMVFDYFHGAGVLTGLAQS